MNRLTNKTSIKQETTLQDYKDQVMKLHNKSPEQFYALSLKALSLAVQLEDTPQIAFFKYCIGYYYHRISSFKKSLRFFNEAITLLEGYKPKELGLLAKIQNAIGAAYRKKGNNAKALMHYYKALEFEVTSVDGMAYNNIANLFKETGDYKKSRKFFKKSAKIHKSINNYNFLAYNWFNLAEIEMKIGNFEKAEQYCRDSANIAREKDQSNLLAISLARLGEISAEQNDIELAEQHLKKAIEIFRSHKFYHELNHYLIQWGKICLKASNYNKSIKLFHESLIISREIGFVPEEKTALSNIHQAYAAKKDYTKAYKYQQELVALQNKIIKDKSKQNIDDVINKQKSEIRGLRKKTDLIKRQNEDLKQYAYIVAHDLKEPLRNICSFADLLKNRYQDEFDKDATEYLNYISGGAKHMNELLSGLLKLNTIENKKDKWESVNIPELLERIIYTHKEKLKEKNVTIKFDKTIPQINGSKVYLTQLFQNLISNGIKFNDKEKIHITIKAINKEDYTIFSVEDNGIGIEEEYFDKVFNLFHRLDKTTQTGSGIGLAIVKKIIQIHNGEIWLESEKNHFTRFLFTLRNA